MLEPSQAQARHLRLAPQGLQRAPEHAEPSETWAHEACFASIQDLLRHRSYNLQKPSPPAYRERRRKPCQTTRGAWRVAGANRGNRDGQILGFRAQYVKPEPAIDQLLQTRYALELARTLMIDDLKGNVDAAFALGWGAIQFVSAQQLRRSLENLLEKPDKGNL